MRGVQNVAIAKSTLIGLPLARQPTQRQCQSHTHSQMQTSTRPVGCAKITPGVEGTLTNCSAQLREHNSMNRERGVGE